MTDKSQDLAVSKIFRLLNNRQISRELLKIQGFGS